MIQSTHQLSLPKLCNNPVKQYAWGRTTQQCYVSRLSASINKYYAELWMGVHCNGQSFVKTQQNSSIKLSQYLYQKGYNPIRFLYKVLSIEKCLSLQVHPNKQQAIKWNKERPHIYADNNDKPQMFYTLTEFQCFFGYISSEQFHRVSNIQIFKTVFSGKQLKNPKEMIIQILQLQEKDQQRLVKECLGILQKIHPTRYNKETKNTKIWRIQEDFPHDIGLVVTFFLDYKILSPGVSYYIQPNMPHAYIYGQCLQIMKNSDNVCRLGLTPKLKDLEVINQALGEQFQVVRSIEAKKMVRVEGVTEELFQKQGLSLLVIRYEQKKQNQQKNIENQQRVKLERDRDLRMCLIVEGIFQISEKGMSGRGQICKAGDVVIIQKQIQYQIQKIGNPRQSGLICIGWSSF